MHIVITNANPATNTNNKSYNNAPNFSKKYLFSYSIGFIKYVATEPSLTSLYILFDIEFPVKAVVINDKITYTIISFKENPFITLSDELLYIASHKKKFTAINIRSPKKKIIEFAL